MDLSNESFLWSSQSPSFFRHNLCLQKVAHGIHSPWCKISRHGHMITMMLMVFFQLRRDFGILSLMKKKRWFLHPKKRWRCGGWPWGDQGPRPPPRKLGCLAWGSQLSDRRRRNSKASEDFPGVSLNRNSHGTIYIYKYIYIYRNP